MKKILSIGLILFLCACTTVIEQDKTKSLVVSSKIDKSIYLVPVIPAQKSILVDVKNSTKFLYLDIATAIKSDILKKGYTFVNIPSNAMFIIQANIEKIKDTYNKETEKTAYTIETNVQISQRISESIYLTKKNETEQNSILAFKKDDFYLLKTANPNGNGYLYWKTYDTKLITTTNETSLTFNDIASIVNNKISDVIVSVF